MRKETHKGTRKGTHKTADILLQGSKPGGECFLESTSLLQDGGLQQVGHQNVCATSFLCVLADVSSVTNGLSISRPSP